MKPIIMDMKDMSDSVELYESRPNPAIIGFIYVLLGLLFAAFAWMIFFEIDIVVKSNGMFRGDSETVEVGCEFTGKVTECNVRDGQFIREGDVLFSLESISNDNVKYYQKELENVEDRLEILQAYQAYLDGDEAALEACLNNQYLQETLDRKELLLANIEAGMADHSGQVKGYRDNVKLMQETIGSYEDKRTKLEKTIEGVKKQNNPFGEEDPYYGSILSSYFSNYSLTASQYDVKAADYQKLINEYDEIIANLKQQRKEEEDKAVMASGQQEVEKNSEVVSVGEQEELPDAEAFQGKEEPQKEEPQKEELQKEELQKEEPPQEKLSEEESKISDALIKQIDEQISSVEKKRADAVSEINALLLEKQKALSTLELQQIASIEQQIDTINGNIQTVKANIATTENQIKALDDSKEEGYVERCMLTEKGNATAEIQNALAKKNEIESIINQRNLQEDRRNVVANSTGYFYLKNEVRVGSFLQAGSKIGNIYPEQEENYHAEIYVSNADIGMIQRGQEVKFEIAAYPSSEYGFFTGRVASMAKDIAVDQRSGNAYYLVEVECDEKELKNKDGKSAVLMNGLACQAKIVTGKEKVLWYFLKKIDLVE